MKRAAILTLVLALLVPWAYAEVGLRAISATASSATYYLTKPSNSVMVCNLGSNEVYFRLGDETDTAGAATTSNILLPAGSTASPVCMSFDKAQTEAGRWAWISTICDTAETATVHLLFQ